MIREREYNGLPGIPVMLTLLVAEGALIWLLVTAIQARNPVSIILTSIGLTAITFLMFGAFMVHPNQGKVLQLFGAYSGTAKVQGLRWANPFSNKREISLRTRNFETTKIKVNDIEGNPIEIGAVVVWRVVDTAQAMFEVDNFVSFVHIQAETAPDDRGCRSMRSGDPSDGP